MSCESCRNALQAEYGKVDSVNAALSEPCACENFSVSDLSPGPVASGESLHYLVPTPEGRTADGFLHPTLLVQVDKNGLSVLRGAADDSEFAKTAEELRPRWQTKQKTLDGIMTFSVDVVRYNEGGDRLCCVYDTGLPDKPNHADLMMPSVGSDISKSERERRQKKRIKSLIDKIGNNNFEPISTFREGRLAHLGE